MSLPNLDWGQSNQGENIMKALTCAAAGGVVAAIALVPIAGFFTTGTSSKLPLGGAVSGFVDEDVPLAFAATPAQQPMVVTPTGVIPPAEPVEATLPAAPGTHLAGTPVP